MNYSFLDFLTLVGSLGMFLYGMKTMSEGLQKVAGDKQEHSFRHDDESLYGRPDGTSHHCHDPVVERNDGDGGQFRQCRAAYIGTIHQRHHGG